MYERTIPSLPRAVSVLGFGTWSLGGESFAGQTASSLAPENNTAIAAVHRALALGIRFFDTAESYGNGAAQRVVGSALATQSTKVTLSVKVGQRIIEGKAHKDFSPAALERGLEESLQRLQRSEIELLMLHAPPEDFVPSKELRAQLDRWKELGKISAYGVACASCRSAELVLEQGFGTVVEVVYNLLDRRAEERVLPMALERGVGVLARVPLASGFLTGTLRRDTPFAPSDVRSTLSAEEVAWRFSMVDRLEFLSSLPGGLPVAALRFCAAHPAILSVLPGMKTTGEVEANVFDGSFEPLPQPLVERVRSELDVCFRR